MSQFLPKNFKPSSSIALVAGKPSYPDILARRILDAGFDLKLIGFEGETSQELKNSFSKEDSAIIKVGQVGKMLKAIKRMNVSYVIMAGQLTPGKLFRGLHPDVKAIRILASLKEKNASTIFGAIVSEIESIGAEVLDARCFMDEDLASNDLMTGGKLKVERGDVQHGIHIAKEVAKLDIGQGVVVRKGTVIAVEAFEGTDAMLIRAGEQKAGDMIFVKTVKQDQDYRFDVPVFGDRTLRKMKEAGIHTAVLEVNKALLLNKLDIVEKAREMKIQLLGYEY